jgi:DNA modification methylase
MFFGHDSRKLSDILPLEPSVNAIITSPPYFDLKDYGDKRQIGYGAKSFDAYLKDLDSVFKQCYQVLKDDGTLWLISDSLKQKGTFYPLPFTLAERLRKMGWKLQDVVIWRKDRTLPFSFHGRFRNLYEYIHIYSKTKNFKFRSHRISERHKEESRLSDQGGGEARYLRGWPERYSASGANPGDVWDVAIPVQGTWKPHRDNGAEDRIHFCPFPQDLVRRIVSIASDIGDIVLDPFAGCGTVAAQTELMGRQYVGVEVNKAFQDAYKVTRVNFRREWIKNAEMRLLEEQDRIEEGDLILRLRQLKHASVWGQLIAEAVRSSRLKIFSKRKPKLVGLITIGRADRSEILKRLHDETTPKGPAYPIDVYLIFDDAQREAALLDIADKQLAERALNKYGLKILPHVLDVRNLKVSALELDTRANLAIYPIKRFFQMTEELSPDALIKRFKKTHANATNGTLSFFASNLHVSLGQKTNVIEEAVRRFVRKLAQESVERLGEAGVAAEYLGLTRGELARLLR